MTKKKEISNDLKNVLNTDAMKSIMDLSKPVDDAVITEVLNYWNSDIFSRKPGQLFVNGEISTDLDLSTFLFELSTRNAVINIPNYKKIRSSSNESKNEVVLNNENRHGKITSIVSNQKTFSFSVRITDQNVIKDGDIGSSRAFSITDFEGNWYDAWSSLEFIQNAKENEFLLEHGIMDKNNLINFKYFVHPNKWVSIFTKKYFITKALIDRLSEEGTYYGKLISDMRKEGFIPPSEKDVEETKDFSYGKDKDDEVEKIKGEIKKIDVTCFNMEIDLPENNTKFFSIEKSNEKIEELINKRKYYIYTVVPALRYSTRICEYAYHKYGKNRIPSWFKNISWESNFKFPNQRTAWDRIILFQNKVGEYGVSLRKRTFTKSEKVSESYYESFMEKKKNILKNYIVFIIDESGSMLKIREEIVSSFNEYVEEIKKWSNEMEERVSLVYFSSRVRDPILWNEDVNKLKKIELQDYNPKGLTALNDAIGLSIDGMLKLDDINDPKVSVLYIILTDGLNNHSIKYEHDYQIKEKIKELEKTGRWSFTFLGKNLDEIEYKYGISKGNMAKFDNTLTGVEESTFVVSAGIHNYHRSRSVGETQSKNIYSSED